MNPSLADHTTTLGLVGHSSRPPAAVLGELRAPLAAIVGLSGVLIAGCTQDPGTKTEDGTSTDGTSTTVADTTTTTAADTTASDSGDSGGESMYPDGCTYDSTEMIVDGSTLWSDIPDAANPANCNFHRFSYNNFLYLVGGPAGSPRFLTDLTSTTQLKLTPSWPKEPERLTGDLLASNQQAGDDFVLVDVVGNPVHYQIRVNQTWWDFVLAEELFGYRGIAAQMHSFKQNPSTGGAWFPPNDTDPGSAIETKTSWRNFGSASGVCPSNIMYCEADDSGDVWGLLGLHLVQKTATRGEMIWASFEHVSNSPDCAMGFSNPLQRDPRDPSSPDSNININEGVAVGAATGWSVFNYEEHTGKDGSCVFPDGAYDSPMESCGPASGTPLCNVDPQDDSPLGFRQVNICRTDPIPDHRPGTARDSVCADQMDNADNVACMTQSVLDHWPAGLPDIWKYYMPVGTQWMNNGDAPVPGVGCFSYSDGPNGINDFECPQPSDGPAIAYPHYEVAGTTGLANTTMETWMQREMCVPLSSPSPMGSTLHEQDCFSCHHPVTVLGHMPDPNYQAFAGADLSHGLSIFVEAADPVGQACNAVCEVLADCGAAEPDCVMTCVAELAGLEPMCHERQLDLMTCVTGLDCAQLGQFYDGMPEPYPCQAEQQAVCR